MKEELLQRIEAVVHRLRSEGVYVSTSEVIDFLHIVENMELLLEKSLDDNELLEVAKAVLAKNRREEELLEKAWHASRSIRQELARVIAAVESDLRRLGLGWGSRIYSKRRLLSGPRAEEKREAYSRLKLLGIIVRGARGDVVLDKETALRKLESILRRYGSAWDALADSAARMIQRGRLEWFSLYAAPVSEERLAGVDVDKIAEAALQALSEGNRRLAEKLAEIVARRLEAGEAPGDSWSVYRLLQRLNMLTPKTLASMLRSEPRLVDELLKSGKTRDILAEALRMLDTRSLSGVLKRVARHPRGVSIAAGLVGEIDLSAWSEVNISRQPRSWEEAVIAAAAILARVEKSLFAAAQGYEAQLDYALSELRRLERIDLSSAPQWAREAITRYRVRVEAELAAFTGSEVHIETIVRCMSPVDALLYLRELYRSGDERLKRRALRLAEIVWRRLEARLYRYRRRGERSASGLRERLDVRRSLYNIVAMREEPLVFRCRRRKPLYALMLDTSGSMAKYSIWGVLAASCFASNVKTLTLFSSSVTVVDDAWRLTRRRLIELIFSVSFEGYTNISAAIRETVKRYSSPAKAILITDLCQTVNDAKPSETIASMARRGWSFAIIVPPRHCVAEKKRVEEYARVEVVSDPEKIPHVLSRILGR